MAPLLQLSKKQNKGTTVTVSATQLYQNCIAVCTTSSDYRKGYTATAQCNTMKELLSQMGNEQIEAFSFTTRGKTHSFKNITASQAARYLAYAIGNKTEGK